MIIRSEGDTLLLIRQPDHARLAAELLSAWRANDFATNPRRDAILLAAREHDNGWLEEDTETIVDVYGVPVDFVNCEPQVKFRLWPRGVRRLTDKHPYAAALVAQHAWTVYGDHHGKPQWHGFFDEMASLRNALLARIGGTAAETIDADYPLLRIVDLLSLSFCTRMTPLEYNGTSVRLDGDTLHVSPDPFDGGRIPVRVLGRRIPNRPFASSADLRAALDDGEMVMVEGVAKGG